MQRDFTTASLFLFQATPDLDPQVRQSIINEGIPLPVQSSSCEEPKVVMAASGRCNEFGPVSQSVYVCGTKDINIMTGKLPEYLDGWGFALSVIANHTAL